MSSAFDWRAKAACRDKDPELFFPVGNTGAAYQQIEEAKAVCRTCKVIDACLKCALDTNQDYGVLIQKGENEALHLHGFLPAVEDIAQDDELMRLRIGEIPRLIQRLMKFGIKAVNIGGDVVFHVGVILCDASDR